MEPQGSDRQPDAGWLLGLGLILLLPVLVAGGLSGWSIWTANMASFHTIDWSSFASIWESVFNGDRDQRLEFIILLGAVAYVLQFWQWFVYALDGWTLLRPRRLWAVSSCYFGAIIACLLYRCIVNPSIIPTGIWAFTVPGVFLCLTLRLWQVAGHSRPIE